MQKRTQLFVQINNLLNKRYYTAAQLAEIRVPVSVAISERDEFIRLEHIEYLARTIPGAKWVLLQDVTHFAPLQRPDSFNSVLQTFLQH